MSCGEAAELTRHGAGVLHAESIQPLARARFLGRVPCVREQQEAGTLVAAEGAGREAVRIACRRNVRLACLEGGEALHLGERGATLDLLVPWSERHARALIPAASRISPVRELATVAAVGRGAAEGARWPSVAWPASTCAPSRWSDCPRRGCVVARARARAHCPHAAPRTVQKGPDHLLPVDSPMNVPLARPADPARLCLYALRGLGRYRDGSDGLGLR